MERGLCDAKIKEFDGSALRFGAMLCIFGPMDFIMMVKTASSTEYDM
jgi:hypothetical protein